MNHADVLTLHIPVFRTVRLFSESECVVKSLELTSKNQIAPVMTAVAHSVSTGQ